MNRRLQLEIGQKFERWTVLEMTRMPQTPRQRERGNPGTRAALCRCECGTTRPVQVAYLVDGLSKSCGCYKAERTAQQNQERFLTHGLTKHAHYSRWSVMLKRCENPQNAKYPRYGGRGIKVCDEWHDVRVFIAYLETELGHCPVGYSLDRIDNDGDYEPGNMRWASPSMQCANQARFLTVDLERTGPHARLTADQVAEIRRRHAAGEGPTALGREFGVTCAAIINRVRSVPA
jgi:hypothetical protein